MGDKGLLGVVVGGMDDMGEEGMQCMDHPYRSNPGGICAFCLQEKLGKLVSSSKLSSPFFPLQPPLSSSASTPTSTSFRSDAAASRSGLGATDSTRNSSIGGVSRTKIPFLATGSKKKSNSEGGGRKVMAATTGASSSSAQAGNNESLVLKRSKSVAPRPIGGLAEGSGGPRGDAVADSPRKKSFWSFLYLPSYAAAFSAASNNSDNINNRRRSTSSSFGRGREREVNKQQEHQPGASDKEDAKIAGGGEEADSPSGSQASSSFGRKVARSRSVGCGSRSFSGDFLERISTGFGDCTLRRVESHRESKPKIGLRLDNGDEEDGEERQRRMNERVKCGGLFGLGMMSSSPYPLSAAAAPHGRTRSWGWAFASPIRAFRPAASYAIRDCAGAGGPATAAKSFDQIRPNKAPL